MDVIISICDSKRVPPEHASQFVQIVDIFVREWLGVAKRFTIMGAFACACLLVECEHEASNLFAARRTQQQQKQPEAKNACLEHFRAQYNDRLLDGRVSFVVCAHSNGE